MPVEYNWTARRNNHYVMGVIINSTGAAGGTPTDISGWSLEANIRALRNEPDTVSPVVTIATGGSGIVITGGTAGSAQLTWDASVMSLLRERDYWWDLSRTDTDAESTLIEGTVTGRDVATR